MDFRARLAASLCSLLFCRSVTLAFRASWALFFNHLQKEERHSYAVSI